MRLKDFVILAGIIVLWSLVSFNPAYARTVFSVHIRAVPSDQPIAGIEVIFTNNQGGETSVVSDITGNSQATLDDGHYRVTVYGVYNGQPVAFEPFYADGYDVQSFVGLSTFTLTIDPAGTVVHALERDWSGPSQENDATAALAPPATGTAIALLRDATTVAALPVDEANDEASPRVLSPVSTATMVDTAFFPNVTPEIMGNVVPPASDVQPSTSNAVGIIAFTTTSPYQPNQPAKRTDSAPQSSWWVWLFVGASVLVGTGLFVYRIRNTK